MYPLLFPFEDRARCESFLKYALKFNEDSMAMSSALLSKNLIPLISGTEVAFYLGVSPALLTSICHSTAKYYTIFHVPKKSGGLRTITAPRIFLKTIQRYISNCVIEPLSTNQCVHGFEKNRGVSTGAAIHLGGRFLWNIDLQDFFPSIQLSQVKSLLLKAGYPEKAAYLVAKLCTLNGVLPQGAPSSPAISNRIFKDIDDSICSLCEVAGIAYSRYADDLSFSGPEPISGAFRRNILRVIEVGGFRVNPTKSRLVGPKQRREVTGLVINDKLSIPRSCRRMLRSKFHKVSLAPQNYVEEKARLTGFASWVYSHHPEEGRRYLLLAQLIPSKDQEAP